MSAPADMVLNTGPWLTSARINSGCCLIASAAAVTRSVWNPPHGRASLAADLPSLRGSKARAGSSFSYGGVRRRFPKIVDLIEVFARNPNFTCPPEGGRRQAGAESATVARPALQAKTRRVQDLIFQDVSANSSVFVANERAVRRGIPG